MGFKCQRMKNGFKTSKNEKWGLKCPRMKNWFINVQKLNMGSKTPQNDRKG